MGIFDNRKLKIFIVIFLTFFHFDHLYVNISTKFFSNLDLITTLFTGSSKFCTFNANLSSAII